MTSAIGKVSLQFSSAEVSNVIHFSRAGRTVAIVIVILAAAAAATAAIRWTKWRPINACLMCDTSAMDASSAAPAAGAGSVAGTAGAFASPGGGGSTAASPADAEKPRAAEGMGVERSRPVAARGAWQPWGAGTASFRGYSSSGQPPAASLGGMWRLMNLARPGDAAVDTMANAPPAPVTRPQQPASAAKPAATPGKSVPPAAGPRPPAPTAPEAPAASAAEPSASAPISVPPTDPFHEHEKPLPDPFDEQPPSGPLDPGGPGGDGPGGDLSPTPEPGSMLLIGTGLVGILGVLRRRRLL